MKNNKVILVLILLLTFIIQADAQNRHRNGRGDHKHAPEKLEEMKKARALSISTAMQLTADEKNEFVPLLDKYMLDRFALYKSYREGTRETKKKDNKTEEDYNKLIQAQFDLKDKLTELEKAYYKSMSKMLPAQKVHKFRKAEHRFMHKMMDKREE